MDEDEVKCPQCLKNTQILTGRLCVDLELPTDHDFLALLANIQQSAVIAALQPSTSREGEARDMQGASKPEELAASAKIRD